MPTRQTTKMALGWTVAPFRMPARTASLTGIGRVDDVYQHPGQHSFVADKLAQLCEAPIAVPRSLCLAQPCPFADVAQVFQSDAASGAFRPRNEVFADPMVGVFLEPRLLLAQLLQMAFCRFGAAPLKALAQAVIPLAGLFDLLARIVVAVAVRHNVADAQANAQDTFNLVRRGFFNVADRQQIEPAVDQNQVALALSALQQFTLPLTADKRDALASQAV